MVIFLKVAGIYINNFVIIAEFLWWYHSFFWYANDLICK